MMSIAHIPGRKIASLLVALVLAAMIIVIPTPSAAQEDGTDGSSLPATEPLSIVDSARRGRNLVDVIVSAPVEADGAELAVGAWQVISDGSSLALTATKLEGNELDVVLVVDVSGSMSGAPLDSAKAAATAFLEVMPAETSVALVGFGDVPVVEAGLDADRVSVLAAVAELSVDPQAETTLYDALQLATAQFDSGSDAQRSIVVLSDGGDTASVANLADSVDAVADAAASLYAVGLQTGESDTDALRALVSGDETRLGAAADTDGLTSVYRDIAADLTNLYRLTFSVPSESGGDVVIFLDSSAGARSAALVYEEYEPSLFGSSASAPAAAADTSANVNTEIVPVVATVAEPKWYGTTRGLQAGAALFGMGLVLVGWLLFSPEANVGQLAAAGRDRGFSGVQSLGSTPERVTGWADDVLERRGKVTVVANALDRAGIALRPAEFVVIAAVSAIFAGLIVLLFTNLFIAIIVAGLVALGFRLGVSIIADRRRRDFEAQLGSTLQLLAGSLRAGYAVSQAAETVAAEAESPTSDEFHRLVTEHRLGRDFGDSLQAMADRLRSEDFHWVVQAIAIHREVGGDLAEVLDNVGATIRDREYVRRQFQALSAEGRYSAYLILSLPFVVVAALLVTNPEYIDGLFSGGRGTVALLMASVSMSIGAVWIRRLIRPRF